MLTACGHNCGGNALSRHWAQCADRTAYQTTDRRYDLLTGRKPNVRFRRYLVVLVVQMANVGSPPRPRRSTAWSRMSQKGQIEPSALVGLSTASRPLAAIPGSRANRKGSTQTGIRPLTRSPHLRGQGTDCGTVSPNALRVLRFNPGCPLGKCKGVLLPRTRILPYAGRNDN